MDSKFKHDPNLEYFRQIYHYLGPLQISTTRSNLSFAIFCKKLNFPTANHIIDISDDSGLNSQWLEALRTETSQKIFIKTFCDNNKVINKVTKRLPKLSNKEIYFTLVSNIICNSTKYNLQICFMGKVPWGTPYSQSWHLG